MVGSKGSVVVGGEAARWAWAFGGLVVPDGGGECEESLRDAGADTGDGAASVVLEGLGEKDETVAEEIGARALRCLLKHFDLVDRKEES